MRVSIRDLRSSLNVSAAISSKPSLRRLSWNMSITCKNVIIIEINRIYFAGVTEHATVTSCMLLPWLAFQLFQEQYAVLALKERKIISLTGHCACDRSSLRRIERLRLLLTTVLCACCLYHAKPSETTSTRLTTSATFHV